MKNLILLVSFLFSVAAVAQVTEKRDISAFTKINVTGSYAVELVKTGGNTLTISGDQDAVSNTLIEVSGGELKIEMKRNFKSKSYKKLTVIVPVNQLEEADITGSGSITSDVVFTGDFKTSVTGSGKVNLNVKASDAKANVTGSGSVTLKGSATSLKCHVAGSGSLKAADFICDNVSVEVAGSGSAHVYSKKELTGSIAGSGDVTYAGDPAVNDVKVNGSGSFKKR
ncbi:DUF2807 domain-containing protein [Flavobacterium zepuense]|uniref:DUF2807 domain-containing protein n=1 Tax=Flavobacterium zepuense TaxID=2593302 RepID=A0A552VAD5_9FLAO|nr:head GIN domain-containing protein [Flavobacterium zepuense]TRW27448.1 DUF2807 domain-containing protein [Flavobacterium zepuense]